MLLLRWCVFVMCSELPGKILGAKILGLFIVPTYSHQQIYQTMMRALADRGHEVTVISTDPLLEPHKNYRDIDLSFLYKLLESDFDTLNMEVPTPYEFFNTVIKMIIEDAPYFCEAVVKSQELQEFLRSNNSTFDLVLIERMPMICLDGIMHRFGSPLRAAFLSFVAPTWVKDSIGNPHNPGYGPNFLVPYSDHKTFWERMKSIYFDLRVSYCWLYEVIPIQNEIAQKYFYPDALSLYETDRNFSLLLYHTHWSLGSPQPLLPNVVELRGIHIKKTPSPLPQNIQEFMDGAHEGVVYFSLGSNIKTSQLPESAAQTLLDALTTLPQRVLLKWHNTDMDPSWKNIMISKWLPQQSVLAHPNVKLFVTQCGIQSLQEAVYHAVPVLGIPFLQEQKLNVRRIVDEGAGLDMDIAEITEETFRDTIERIIKNQSYTKNMERLSEIFQDEPQSSLELGIWWVEYVLRTNGAKHLRSGVLDLDWTQYLLVDILLFALAAIFISVSMAPIIISVISRNKARRMV